MASIRALELILCSGRRALGTGVSPRGVGNALRKKSKTRELSRSPARVGVDGELRVLFALEMERATGIEPVSEAWEASILPLYDARSVLKLAKEAIGRKLALRQLFVAEAALQVVVHQAGGLH